MSAARLIQAAVVRADLFICAAGRLGRIGLAAWGALLCARRMMRRMER